MEDNEKHVKNRTMNIVQCIAVLRIHFILMQIKDPDADPGSVPCNKWIHVQIQDISFSFAYFLCLKTSSQIKIKGAKNFQIKWNRISWRKLLDLKCKYFRYRFYPLLEHMHIWQALWRNMSIILHTGIQGHSSYNTWWVRGGGM